MQPCMLLFEDSNMTLNVCSALATTNNILSFLPVTNLFSTIHILLGFGDELF